MVVRVLIALLALVYQKWERVIREQRITLD